MREHAEQWWQSEMLPRIDRGGSFLAFISATDKPHSDHSAGYSACAWLIKASTPPREEVLSDAKRSRSDSSEEQRGFVAAALGVVASFRGDAIVTIHTNNQYVVNGLNGGAKRWRSNNWENSSGEPVNSQELWDLILKLSEERGLSVEGKRVTRESCSELEAVHAMALKVLADY